MSDLRKNPVHLLRAILRECSYLPDPAARTYMHKYTIKRFRKHWHRTTTSGGNGLTQPRGRAAFLVDEGISLLEELARANEGYLVPLNKFLMWTYGRAGPRREVLLDPFLQQTIPQTHKDVGSLTATYKFSREWRPSEMFLALTHSQDEHKSRFDRSVNGHQNIPKRNVVVPKENSWGLPLPQSRVKNRTKKWYKRVAEQLLPPLPEPERERLRDLVLQPPSVDTFPKRRVRVGIWETEDRNSVSGDFLLRGPGEGPEAEYRHLKGRPHVITPRLLRTIWAKIYAHTPKVDWDQKRRKYAVSWDNVEYKPPAIGTIKGEQVELLFGNSTARLDLT